MKDDFADFWEDIPIPEGLYTIEIMVACFHTEGSCEWWETAEENREEIDRSKARPVPHWEQLVEFIQAQGGRILAGPRIRKRHRVILAAVPIPQDLVVAQHAGGYWVASIAQVFDAENAGDNLPYEKRAIYEGAGTTKNEAIRNLVTFVEAMSAAVVGHPEIVVAVVDPGMLGGLAGLPLFGTIYDS